jgi:hypothetical protein
MSATPESPEIISFSHSPKAATRSVGTYVRSVTL